MTVDVALAGFGAWGRMHARALSHMEGVRLAAIHRRADAAAAAAREACPGARIFRDRDEMLAESDAGIVSVAVPNHRHAEFAIASFEAGKHVFLEKPLGLTLAHATLSSLLPTAPDVRSRSITNCGSRTSGPPSTAPSSRAGSDGFATSISRSSATLFEPVRAAGYDPDRVGSWLLEELVHFVDLVLWYGVGSGLPAVVRAHGTGREPGLMETLTVTLTWKDGAFATINQCLAGFEHHTLLEIAGDDGAIRTWWSGAEDRTEHPTFDLKLRAGDTVEAVQVPRSGEVFELTANLAAAIEGFGKGRTILSPREARPARGRLSRRRGIYKNGADHSHRRPPPHRGGLNMRLKTLTAGIIAATTALTAGIATAQDSLTVLTWNIPVYEEKIQGWIDEFHETYPDIEVEWIDKKGSDWATFYQTQIAAGTPPDVVNIQGALWAEYAENGQLLDMTPYLEKDPAFSDRFVDGALDLWTDAEGRTWMVPWYFNRTLLFLDKQAMADAGIDSPPTSFDELMSAAEAMSGENENGFITTNWDWLFWPLFKANGVDILNEDMTAAAFNTPEAVETLTRLAEATQSGVINNISWTGRWVEPNTAFGGRNIGMYMAPNSALFWVQGKTDWVNADNVMVAQTPGDWWVPNHHGWGVSADTENPEAAMELIKIATSDKWQQVMAETFSILTLNKNVDPILVESFRESDPLKAEVLEMAGTKLDMITGYLPIAEDARIKDAFWTTVQPALLGQVDPQQALDDAEARVNRILSRR